jgi:hypothetical protein
MHNNYSVGIKSFKTIYKIISAIYSNIIYICKFLKLLQNSCYVLSESMVYLIRNVN